MKTATESRHKIEKSRYKVTNWHDYNNGLRRRGDITIWFTKAAIAEWRPTMTGARGQPQEYSDIAIDVHQLLLKNTLVSNIFSYARVS